MLKESSVLINGLRVNYKVAGEGRPLLILHGWGGSSDSWIDVQRILSNKGYKVLVPDLPGFGKSQTPPEPWGIGDYANFIFSFIKEANLVNFFLLGHSFGGRISARLSINYPDDIKGLILCDSAGIKIIPGPKTLFIFWLSRIGNAVFTPKHLSRFKDSARSIFYAFLRKKDYTKTKGVMRETIKNVLDDDLLFDLPKIKKRTLIIWGKADKLVPVKYAHIFNEKIENSEIEVLPKIGHSPHLEVPEKLSEIILRFLDKIK